MTIQSTTLVLPGERGGWNASRNTDSVSPEGVSSLVNINMHNNARQTRGGMKNLAYKPEGVFEAYNDCNWTSSQMSKANTTRYNVANFGYLKDYYSGVTTPIYYHPEQGNIDAPASFTGRLSNPGTDAYMVFNNKVDCVGVQDFASPYVPTTLTFTGLDAFLTYEIVLFSNSEVSVSPPMVTKTTISGVASFKNTSTVGATFSGVNDATVTIDNNNTTNGYVARFTEIVPNSDKKIILTLTGDDNHSNPCVNAFMLKAYAPTDTITGLHQFVKEDKTELLVKSTKAGTVYNNSNVAIKSGLVADKLCSYEVYNNTLYIANGSNVPQTWDGVADYTSDLANKPSDWSSTNYPTAFIRYGRGTSAALWAYGTPLHPERIYCSENGTDDFSDAKVWVQNIKTGDGYGVVGMVVFGQRLFAIGRNYCYIIEDDDINRANWGYSVAQWKGGAASRRLICKTPNDVVAMSDDLTIYSVVTTQQYGDYIAIALNRPMFIHDWMRENLNLDTMTTQWHMIFDPNIRAIKIFVCEKGHTTPNACLVYFIDRGVQEGWSLHRYSGNDVARCSAEVLAANKRMIYTGGADFGVYQTEHDECLDNGTPYYSGFKTSMLNMNGIRALKKFERLWVSVLPMANETLKARITIDGREITGNDNDNIVMVDNEDNFIVDDNSNVMYTPIEGEWFSTSLETVSKDRIVEYSKSIGYVGNRLQAEVYCEGDGSKGMFLTQLMVDFSDAGNKPY